MMISTNRIIFNHETQEGVELNRCYLIEFYNEEILAKIKQISFCNGVYLLILARKFSPPRRGYYEHTIYTISCNELLDLHYRNRIHEVKDIKELPLYIGWNYISPELFQMIKQGTWEITVCK